MRLPLLIPLLFGLAACAAAPLQPLTIARNDYEQVKRELASRIRQQMEANDMVGLSIALTSGDRLVWSEGFGESNHEQNESASADTQYRVGSVTKLFTATAVTRLAAQGKLKLDAPVHDLLPEFKIRSHTPQAAITPRQLITHHSGLPADVLNGRETDRSTDLLTHLNEEYTARPPNVQWAYSNAAYGVLGHIISRVTEHSYTQHMREALLQPLGMTRSTFEQTPDRVAASYSDGEREDFARIRDQAAGSLQSNVVDLSRFLRWSYGRPAEGAERIMPEPWRQQMVMRQNRDIARDFNLQIGLGWMLDGLQRTPESPQIAWHDGSIDGFSSLVAMAPGEQVGVVLLANSSGLHEPLVELAQLALEMLVAVKQGGDISPDSATRDTAPAPQPIPLPEKALGRYGITGPPSLLVELVRKEEHYYLTGLGPKLELYPLSDGSSGARAKWLGLISVGEEELRDLRIKVHTEAEAPLLLQRVMGVWYPIAQRLPNHPLPPEWQSHLGTYRIVNGESPDEQGTAVTLHEHQGLLEIKVPESDELRWLFLPVDHSHAVTVGTGRGAGETLRVVGESNATRLRFSGYVIEKRRPGSL